MRLLPLLAQVTVEPDATGLPFMGFLQTIVNWVAEIALWGSLLSFLVGACVWGLSNMHGNPYGAGQGQKLVMGGAIGACLVALADSIVNALHTAADGAVPPV